MAARKGPTVITVRQHIAWAYANLARAHTALEEGSVAFKRHHHIIRARLYAGLVSGKMSMRSIFDDERLKMTLPQTCAYCGTADKLALDHLVPRYAGGRDDPANLVWACRGCNSAKGRRDMLRWMLAEGRFPSLFVLRRYLKCMQSWCEERDILDKPAATIDPAELPFALNLFPLTFPPLEVLQLWVKASDVQSTGRAPRTR